MRLSRTVTLIVVGWAALMSTSMPGLAAQAPHHAATAKAKPAGDMDAKCQAMMAEREKMMADMKAADQRLDDLVAKMNAASGAAKTEATAEVVNEMVSQRRTMQSGMAKMQQDMMGHMMAHVQAGASSMAGCPMMKKMGDMKP